MKRFVLPVAVIVTALLFCESATAGPRWRMRKVSRYVQKVEKPYRYRPAPMAAIRIFPVGPGRPRYPSQ